MLSINVNINLTRREYKFPLLSTRFFEIFYRQHSEINFHLRYITLRLSCLFTYKFIVCLVLYVYSALSHIKYSLQKTYFAYFVLFFQRECRFVFKFYAMAKYILFCLSISFAPETYNALK